MSDERPPPATEFELSRFLGSWYILITNYGYWRSRYHPRVEYAQLEPTGERARFSDTLRFSKDRLFGGRAERDLAGVDTQERADVPACFVWRANGLLGFIRSRWTVMMVDPEYRWAVTYFEKSNIGTAPGMDVYAREPVLEPATLDEILQRVRADPFLATRCEGLFATEQAYTPKRPYRLG